MTEEIKPEDLEEIQNQMEEVTPESEKMIPVSEVNKHIAGAKKKAYEKAKRELQSNANLNYDEPLNSQEQKPEFSRDIMREELNNILKEQQESQAKAYEQERARKIYSELHDKVTEAQKRIPDYDEVTSNFDFTSVPAILEHANHFENGGDILYDLAKNPMKIGNLLSLVQHPAVVHAELKKLSDSIKQNELAKDTKLANEPLQAIRSSNVGADNGKLTLADYKKMFRG